MFGILMIKTIVEASDTHLRKLYDKFNRTLYIIWKLHLRSFHVCYQLGKQKHSSQIILTVLKWTRDNYTWKFSDTIGWLEIRRNWLYISYNDESYSQKGISLKNQRFFKNSSHNINLMPLKTIRVKLKLSL